MLDHPSSHAGSVSQNMKAVGEESSSAQVGILACSALCEAHQTPKETDPDAIVSEGETHIGNCDLLSDPSLTCRATNCQDDACGKSDAPRKTVVPSVQGLSDENLNALMERVRKIMYDIHVSRHFRSTTLIAQFLNSQVSFRNMQVIKMLSRICSSLFLSSLKPTMMQQMPFVEVIVDAH